MQLPTNQILFIPDTVTNTHTSIPKKKNWNMHDINSNDRPKKPGMTFTHKALPSSLRYVHFLPFLDNQRIDHIKHQEPKSVSLAFTNNPFSRPFQQRRQIRLRWKIPLA